jgi:CRISPR-associated protein Cas5d
MTYGIKLLIRGDYACFTRPEMKVERVSYDVITPSAARGILEAIHWKPAIRWVVDRIHVLRPIRFESIRRNEVDSKIPAGKVKTAMKNNSLEGLGLVAEQNHQQRAMLALRDVAYGIEAHFEMTPKAGPADNVGKHMDMFTRRAKTGQCFHRPAMGVREFPAWFEGVEKIPPTELPETEQSRDLGWMLYDIDFANGRTPLFFRATMEKGVIDVARSRNEGLIK